MISIEHFLLVAEAVLGIDAERLKNVTKIGLAESALAAPFATYGGHDFYEHHVKRAAIVASRIVCNHPLPDGNKRVALLLMDLYSKRAAGRSVAPRPSSPKRLTTSRRARTTRTTSTCGSAHVSRGAPKLVDKEVAARCGVV